MTAEERKDQKRIQFFLQNNKYIQISEIAWERRQSLSEFLRESLDKSIQEYKKEISGI